MMKDAGNGPEGGDAGGLSFSMLSRLIAEGRTEEVPVKKIPEGTNVSHNSQRGIQEADTDGSAGYTTAKS
jgi:hypothetical protein